MSVEQIKARLETYKESIVERREKLARHVSRREEPLPQDFAEQAVELENDETMVALEQELHDQLRDVDKALERLDEGGYGECTQCGDQISRERLQALPATPFCFACADAIGR